jgi:site-specific DNA-methyltransferase (cytosine-N4-specific)
MFDIDIAYDNYSSKGDIHGVVLYPAPMIAPIQNKILEEIAAGKSNITIFDPFHGSGVALFEASIIAPDSKIIGYDINPYANLITKSKLQGINIETIETDISFMRNLLEKTKFFPIHHFEKIDKWFRQDIKEHLSIIKYLISALDESINKNFFWIIFGECVRKYSNSRSSTYKLHTKTEQMICDVKNNVVDYFFSKAKEDYTYFMKSHGDFELVKCDSIIKMSELQDDEIDILITSPPYGDNQTTVPYGQFSSLPLMWIEEENLDMDGWELDNFNIIDSMSLGGNNSEYTLTKFEADLIDNQLTGISKSKQRKVINFLNDYLAFLNQAKRVTNDYIILTLGNRRVDNVQISLTEITIQFFENSNFRLVKNLTREIKKKRIAKYTSRINKKPVKSMTYEHVLIFKKSKVTID